MPEAGASGETRTDTEMSAYVCIHVLERLRRMEDGGWSHVKGLDLEALSVSDVHTRMCSSVMLLKLLLEHLSHILWGHIMNTASMSKHYHCRTHSLSCSPLTESISMLVTDEEVSSLRSSLWTKGFF